MLNTLIRLLSIILIGHLVSTNVMAQCADIVVEGLLCPGNDVQFTAVCDPEANYWEWNDGQDNGTAMGPSLTLTLGNTPDITVAVGVQNDGSVLYSEVFMIEEIIIDFPPAGPFCLNDEETNLDASPMGGEFSGPGIEDPNQGLFVPSLAGPGSHVITYTFAPGSGCSASEQITINVFEELSGVMEISSPSVCLGEDAELKFSILEGVAPYTIVYSIDGIQFTETSPTNELIIPMDTDSPGSFDYYFDYFTDNTGCESEACCLQTFTVNALPNANISLVESSGNIDNDGVICKDDEVVLTASGGADYEWDNGLGSGAVKTVNPGSTTTYTVTVTDSNGCQSTADVTITVNSLPEVILNEAGPYCIDGSPENLLGSPVGGLFDGNGITNTANGTFDPSVAGVGIHTITYTYEDENGCSDFASIDVQVLELPVVSISDPGSFCINDDPVQLSGSPMGPMGEFSGNGITDNSGTFDPVIAGIGTHTITFTYTDDDNCSNSTTIDLEVNDLAEFSIISLSCSSDLLSYSISFSTNADNITSSHGIVDISGSMITQIPAEQNVTITITSGDNCVNTIEIEAPNCECPVISPPFQAFDGQVCFGEPNPTLSVSVETGFSANWYGQAAGGDILVNGENTLSYTPLETNPGTYSYFVETFDPITECKSASRTVVMLVIFELPNPNVLPQNGQICEGSTLTLSVEQEYQEYVWNDNSMNETLDITAGGNYSVMVTDFNSCVGTGATFIEQKSIPGVTFPVTDIIQETCDATNSDPIEFFLEGEGTIMASYTFNGGDPIQGIVTNSNTLLIENPELGVYKVVAISDDFCSTPSDYMSASITLQVNQDLDFSIIKLPVSSDLVCEGDDFTLTTDLGDGNFSFSWETPVGIFMNETIELNSVDASYEGSYILTVIDNDTGCQTVQTQEIVLSDVEGTITSNDPDNQICLGQTISLIAEGFSGTITWINEELQDVQNDALVEVSPTQTTLYTAIISNSVGCEIVENIEIVVNPLPIPQIVGDASSYCEDSEVTLSTTESFVSYNWNTGSEESMIIIQANPNIPNYSVVVEDENGCQGIDLIELDIKTIPVAGISTDVEIIEALSTAEFSVVDPSSDTDCPIFRFDWYVDGEFIESTFTEDDLFSYQFMDEGFFDVCLVVVDDCGCSSEGSCVNMDVAANGSCSISFPVQDNFCAGACSALVANPIPGETATVPIDGHFIIDGIDIDELIELNEIQTGVTGLQFIIKETFFKTDEEFLDSIIVEFQEPGNYPYQFFVNYSNACIRTSGVRNANVQQIPSFNDFILDKEACFGEKLSFEFDIPSNSDDFVLNYELDGNPYVKIFNGASDTIQLPSPLNLPSVVDVTFIDLVGYKSTENINDIPTGCENDGIDTSFQVEFLEELTFVVDTICLDNENFEVQYDILFNGGTGMVSVNGEAVTQNPFQSDIFENGEATTFTIVDEGCDEENSEIISVAGQCETCVSFQPIAEEQNISFNGDQYICSSDEFQFTLTPEPDIFEGQRIVFAVFNQSTQQYTESSLVYSEAPSNSSVFTFDVNSSPNLETNTEYFITAFIFEKDASAQGFSVDTTCLGLNPKQILIYEDPNTNLENLEDDFDVCKNEFDFQMRMNLDALRSAFTVTPEEFTTLHTIEGKSQVLLDVSPDIPGNSTISVLLEQEKDTIIGGDLLTCSNSDEILLNVLDASSPSIDSIIRWPGDLYAFTGDDENYCYQWMLNGQPIEGETDRFYIKGSPLETDDILSIQVNYCDVTECVSEIYFNATEPPGLGVNPEEGTQYTVFPNPATGLVNIKLKGDVLGFYRLRIYNTTGQFVMERQFEKEEIEQTFTLRLDHQATGLYLMQISDEDGNQELIKLLKQ